MTPSPSDVRPPDTVVRIRPTWAGWLPLAMAGVFIVVMGLTLRLQVGRPTGWIPLIQGIGLIGEALVIRTFGVDLLPGVIRLRGLRRRRIPCEQVQAVVPYSVLGSRMVRLYLPGGVAVRLRAPATLWTMGNEAFERDYHRIGQWWLAHRGPEWQPAGPVRQPVPGWW